MKFGPNLHRPPDDQVPRERLPTLEPNRTCVTVRGVIKSALYN